eukprot:CAMPEP_0176168946 /NCGR_PEP_ID=MMETSP0120_2-20121206/86476_1 /TAXON_ID=160619 /ORGANISM="Kryptoperidinium foliaceum, Strain CCMP 1326" /LENGTH=497 /DNA_ID=CAMNT_0017506685 /DNA_START=17 /DNA_END=1510 /DNA_ORIENTATION=-
MGEDANSGSEGDGDVRKLVQSELSELARRGITHEDLLRKLRQQEVRLRAAQMYQPDLFAPLWQQPPAGGANGMASEAGTGVVRSAGWDWEQSIQRDRRIGEDAGLVDRGRPGHVYCPCCDHEVAEGYCERHVESARHRRSSETKRHMDAVAELHRRGELPPWIELREGAEYCTLCWAYATEGHLESAKHIQRVQHQQGRMIAPAQLAGIEQSSPSSATPAALGAAPVAPVICSRAIPQVPPDWGSPEFYEWKDDRDWFWCKLCGKTADESHVYSKKHRNRMLDPGPYLQEWDSVGFSNSPWAPQLSALPAPPETGAGIGGATWAVPPLMWATPAAQVPLWADNLPPPPPPTEPPPAQQPLSSAGGAAAPSVPEEVLQPTPASAPTAPEPPMPVAPAATELSTAESAAEPAPQSGGGIPAAAAATKNWDSGLPAEAGYLVLVRGEPVQILYVGTVGDEIGWSFGALRSGEQGWFPSDAVAPSSGAAPRTRADDSGEWL